MARVAFSGELVGKVSTVAGLHAHLAVTVTVVATASAFEAAFLHALGTQRVALRTNLQRSIGLVTKVRPIIFPIIVISRVLLLVLETTSRNVISHLLSNNHMR